MSKETENIGKLEILEHTGSYGLCIGMIGEVKRVLDTQKVETNIEIECTECGKEGVIPRSHQELEKISNNGHHSS